MKMEIVYEWWNDSIREVDLIDERHKNELIEHAVDRISHQIKSGYSAGELLYEIEDVSYRGWWEMKEND